MTLNRAEVTSVTAAQKPTAYPDCKVIKRSMAAGFAGIDNPLYYLDHNLMLFGDAKNFVGNIVRELTGAGSDGHGG